MLMLKPKEVGWWFWVISVVFLGLGLLGSNGAFLLLIALSAFQVYYYAVDEISLTSFPVQVRIAFFLIVTLCYFEPFRLLYWIPFIGVTAQVLVGYCLMARLLSLAPWNRKQPLTSELFKKTIFSPPIKGSVLQKDPEDKSSE